MSIIQIRKAMENKGCQVFLGLIGVLIVLGMIIPGLNFGGNDPAQQAAGTEIFSVGSQKVTSDQFEAKMNELAVSQMAERGTPQGELALAATAVANFVNEAAKSALAKEKGVAVTKENIRQLGELQAQQSLDQTRVQMMMGGQIKPDATEAQANQELEKLLGKPRDQWIKESVDALVKAFDDSTKKKEVQQGMLGMALVAHYKNNVKYSEDDLKNSFSEFTFEVIRFEDLKKSLGDRQDQALKALDEIKGGTKFSEVQTKYNADAKPEDKTVTLSLGLIEVDPTLSPLKDLKVGETSEIILQSGSPVIYQMKSVTTKLPKDFEKNKATLLENAKASRANVSLDEDFKAKSETLTPSFKENGLKAAYLTYKLLTDQAAQADAAKYEASMKELLTEIKGYTDAGSLAIAAEFVLSESLYSKALPADQKTMMEDRLDIAARMLDSYEDSAFRVRFAQELLDHGMTEDAYSYLLEAAELNSDYEAVGQGLYSQITTINKKALTDKKFTDEEHQSIQKLLDKWLTEKVEYEKDKAAQAAEDKKIQDELDKEVVPETTGTTGSEAPKTSGTTGTTGTGGPQGN